MTGTSRRAGSNNRSALTEKLAMSTIAHDTALASIVADAGPHDTPYLHPFHGCRLVDLLRVPRFQEEVAASPAALTAPESAIQERNKAMHLDASRVPITNTPAIFRYRQAKRRVGQE